MNILLIPATDWLRHPVISRQHHIFERIAKKNKVHVLQFDLYPENSERETNLIIHRLRKVPVKGLATYYILNMGPYSKEIMSIVSENKIDVIVVTNLLPGIPAFLGKNFGCKIVFDLKDMFSDNSAIYYRNVLLRSIIKGISEWLLQRLLKRADHVIAVSMFLLEYAEEIGVKNISLITNGVELGIFKPNLPQNKLCQIKENIHGEKVIGFVGTIDRWLDFETVFLAFKELLTKINDLKLLIVGGKMVSSYFDEVQSHARRIGVIDKVIFTGIVPHAKVPYYVNVMDVCLIPMKSELRLNQARCPDKLFEYLACGKPVVSTPISEVVRIGQGAVRFYNDVPGLVTAIMDILSDESLRVRMEKKALLIAKDYSWQVIADIYKNVLGNVAND